MAQYLDEYNLVKGYSLVPGGCLMDVTFFKGNVSNANYAYFSHKFRPGIWIHELQDLNNCTECELSNGKNTWEVNQVGENLELQDPTKTTLAVYFPTKRTLLNFNRKNLDQLGIYTHDNKWSAVLRTK